MNFLRPLLFLPLLGMSPVVSCKTGKTADATEHPVVQPDKPVALKLRRAIVFVHGIHGTSEDTWRVSPNGPYWPDMVKSDSQFADADVLTMGYPSPFLGNKSGIADIANALADKLTPVFATHDQVVFICHSLGGLVVEEMLLNHPKFVKQVPSIVSYATPHGASVVAAYGSVFLDDPLLKAMTDDGGDSYIWALSQRWKNTKFPIHSYCVFEEQKMRPHDLSSILIGGVPSAASKLADFIGGIIVVNRFSATYGCDNNDLPFEGVDANHIDIVKPAAKGVGAYALFSKYYATTQPPPVPVDQIISYDKVVCATYGEANQGQNAWNQDFQCQIPDARHLDHDYRRPPGSSVFAGGGASTDMTMASVPSGFDVIADGAFNWSVRAPSLGGDTFTLHTHCGPSGGYGGGCNVKAKIVAHYKVNVTQEARQLAQ